MESVEVEKVTNDKHIQDNTSADEVEGPNPVVRFLKMNNTISKGISGGTLIFDTNGLRSIEKYIDDTNQVNSDISVNTFHGIEKTSKIFKGLLKPSVKIITRLGYTIEGSSDHLLMTRRETEYDWKKLSEFKIGEYITMRVGNNCGKQSPLAVNFPLKDYRKSCTIPNIIDEDLCYIFGLLVGDGCFSKEGDDYMVEYCSDDAELLEIYQKIVKEKFDIKCGTYYRSENFGKAYFCRKKVRKFLLRCGLKYTTAREKEAPWVVLENTLGCQKTFLRGLYDTDGGVNKTCVHYTTASTLLASHVHNMLLNLGIISTKSYTKGTDSWRISIYGRAGLVFVENINFYCYRKKKLAEEKYSETKTVIPKSNTLEIPGGQNIVKLLKNEIYNRKQAMGNPRSLLRQIELGKSELRYYHIPYLLEEIKGLPSMGDVGNELVFMNNNGIFFDSVAKITIGEAIIYDIEVEGSNSFIGNGMVNCGCVDFKNYESTTTEIHLTDKDLTLDNFENLEDKVDEVQNEAFITTHDNVYTEIENFRSNKEQPEEQQPEEFQSNVDGDIQNAEEKIVKPMILKVIKAPYFPPKVNSGKRYAYNEVDKCLTSLGYVLQITEIEYNNLKITTKLPALCPGKHRICTVSINELRNGNTCCRDCGNTKRAETNMKKFGTKTPLQNEVIKEKIKQSNILKLGVPYPMQNKKVIEKAKQTVLLKKEQSIHEK